jgi:glutathionylspermidine synthase
MKRHILEPRPDWVAQTEALGWGFFATSAGEKGDPYWHEKVAYEFTAAEIDLLENTTNELQERCLETVAHVVSNPELLNKLGIPSRHHEHVRRSWERSDPSLYGRMDFAYLGGDSQPKLLEYNADTPTVVLETAVLQWQWLQAVRPGSDQFNSLHEALLENFQALKCRIPGGETFYFAGIEESEEEYWTCVYLQDLATQAGLKTKFINLPDVGLCHGINESDSKFVDLEGNEIKYWFKLYPWEWLVEEEFGFATCYASGIVEPAWKMVLSNKGLLPIMWDLFPEHPNLLPASFDHPVGDLDGWSYMQWERTASPEDLERYAAGELYPFDYITKPMLSREGANIDYFEKGKLVHRTGGEYTGPRIYQEFAPTFTSGEYKAIIGSWIARKVCGIMVRDVKGLIVQDTTAVVPHWFDP